MRFEIPIVGASFLLVSRRNEECRTVIARELVDCEERVDRHQVAVEDPRKVAMESRLEHLRRLAFERRQQQAVLDVEDRRLGYGRVDDGKNLGKLEQLEEDRIELQRESEHTDLAGTVEAVDAHLVLYAALNAIHRLSYATDELLAKHVLDDDATDDLEADAAALDPILGMRVDARQRVDLLGNGHRRIKAPSPACRRMRSGHPVRVGPVKRCVRCESVFDSASWRCPTCGYEPAKGDFLRFADNGGGGSFPSSSFELLARLEQRSFWFRARNEIVLAAIRRHFPDPATFFELGCGTGFVLRAIHHAFPHAELVAGEKAADGLKVARSRVPEATLLQLDGRRLPYRDEFDVVGAFDVVEHVDDDEQLLEELGAALRRGGGMVITVPQHPWLWSAADDFGGHRRRYTRHELVAKLQRRRLEVVYVTSFMTLLLPIMAASRLRQRDLETFDPEAELRLPPGVDRAFARMVSIERLAIGRGISLPVGGSLLAVARRVA
jgi:SAM-dependent methyltransferase